MDTIPARRFRDELGHLGWHAGRTGAHVTYRTGDFATGARLFAAIAALAEEADHHPDVEVGYPRLSLNLITHSAGGLTEKDLALARQISAAATDLGVEPDASTPQRLMLAVATPDPAAILPVWQAATGYRAVSETELRDPAGRGPLIWLQRVDRPLRGRTHLDVVVPRADAPARVEAALAAGGTLADDTHAPQWWTIADADGHKIDIASARA